MRWGGVAGRLPGPALGIGARDVEVAQHDGTQLIGAARILQHPFHHQLGAAVGRHGLQRPVLGDVAGVGLAVDGRRRGEDELPDAGPHRALDEVAGLGGVVEVIAERVRDRFRHHDAGGEMRDGVDAVLGEGPLHQRLVAEIALHQGGGLRHGGAKAGRQVVDDDDGLARIEQRQHHVAADVAGAARHQNRHGPLPSIPIRVAPAPDATQRKPAH